MDDQFINRLRDSSIAAALNALAPTGEPDTEYRPEDALPLLTDADTQIGPAITSENEEDRQILDACAAIAQAGVRPRPKGVMAYLLDKYRVAPSKDLVTQLVRRWKAEQWKSEAVRTAYLAYVRLDAEQRAALESRIEVDRQSALAAASEERTMTDPFLIRMHLRDGSSRIETADRATVAFVKFQNRIDRHQPNHVCIDLVDRSSGVEKIVRRCKFAPGGRAVPASEPPHDLTDWR